MGQKTIPTSLRTVKKNIIWSNPENFVKYLTLRNFLIHYFYKKGILINNLSIKKINNILYINLDFIISRTSRIYAKRTRRYFKKRIFLRKKNFKFFFKRRQKKLKTLKNLFSKLIKIFNTRKLYFKANRLETKINKKIVKYTKKMGYSIRLKKILKNLTLKDFFKIACLFLTTKKANPSLLLFLLSKHFTWLPKRQHKRFLTFVRDFFELLYSIDKKLYKRIYGIKLLVNGRIAGKTKASNFDSSVGSIFTSTISKNVNYATTISYSKLGVFGWRIWITTK